MRIAYQKRLRKRNLLGHTVSIKVRYDDFTTVSRQKRLDTPSDHEHVFFETALLLWNKLMQDKTSKKPKGTKKDIEVLGATTKVKSTNLNLLIQTIVVQTMMVLVRLPLWIPRALYDY